MSSVLEHSHAAGKKPAAAGCQCGHSEPVAGCCDLICFERPNYFCGHLLSDQDLMREQRYFREKNRLYHRALHGQGIVCGLRLMCEGACAGHVAIETGFAIDDCGNDLVVCEPARYNVIKALRDKGWLIEPAQHDACKPRTDEEECKPRQCFYVVACYAEEPGDYITPFVPGCKTALKDCEPTRIRETVRFDVWDKLPPKSSFIESYAQRIGGCFDLFSEGAFAQYLRDHQTQIVRILQKDGGAQDRECGKIFCELRALLLLYLKKHPERYHCTLEQELRDLTLQQQRNDGGEECAKALCRLIELAVQHAFSCAMNELMPHCPPAKEPGCIVLGTVEVEGSHVVRVCNCPREYVWSFANFFEVLLATLVSDNLCKERKPDRKRGEDRNPCEDASRHVCCADIDVSCEEIVRLLSVNSKAMRYRSVAGLDAAMQMRESLAAAVDFTRRGVYAPAMFAGMSINEAQAAAEKLGVQTQRARASLMDVAAAPFDMLRRVGLATVREPLVLVTEEKGAVVESYAEVPVRAAGRGEVPDDDALAKEIRALHERIERLETRLKDSPPPGGTRTRGPKQP